MSKKRATPLWFWLTTVPAYLLVIWIVSSASLDDGLFVFAVGGAALMGGGVAFGLGRRRVLYGVFLFGLLVCAVVAAFETVLWLMPGVLQGELANHTYSGYHEQRGGIYQSDPHLNSVMRPGMRRTMYWNGHWWRHHANHDGYRGPRVKEAGAVFLGDSMIYGHGVESHQTVPARFESETGMKVANLGQQGACMIQAMMLLSRKGSGLSPRYVLLCCHPTDLADLTGAYKETELKRFLASPVEEYFEPVARAAPHCRSPWSAAQTWNTFVALPLRSSRALDGMARSFQSKSQLSPGRTGRARRHRKTRSDRFVPRPQRRQAPFAPWEEERSSDVHLQWRVHTHAVAKIKHLCNKLGAELILFDLGYPQAFSAAMEDLAEQLDIAYSTAGRVALKRALAGEDIYLVNDGHWTPLGCEVITAELARLVLTGRPSEPDTSTMDESSSSTGCALREHPTLTTTSHSPLALNSRLSQWARQNSNL